MFKRCLADNSYNLNLEVTQKGIKMLTIGGLKEKISGGEPFICQGQFLGQLVPNLESVSIISFTSWITDEWMLEYDFEVGILRV